MSTRDPERTDDELLSALLDGELSTDEELRLLERLDAEPALQRRWARYNAARAALTSGAGRMAPDFVERVARARAEEPAVLAPRRARRPRAGWVRPVAGVAVAASVALIAVGALSVLRGPATEGPPVSVASRSGSSLEAGGDAGAVAPVAVSTVAGATDAERARQRQRLMLYLASHSEYADAGEMPTVIPYGRLGGLNAGQ